jgi:hypothetical protein
MRLYSSGAFVDDVLIDAEPIVPVDPTTWGAIKAHYR